MLIPYSILWQEVIEDIPVPGWPVTRTPPLVPGGVNARADTLEHIHI